MGFLGNAQQFLSGTKKDSKSKPPWLLSIRSSTTLIVLTGSCNSHSRPDIHY